jgi:hypothetical protein
MIIIQLHIYGKGIALCEEEGHAIMDCVFVPFHIKAGITKHVEFTECGWSINGSTIGTRIRNSYNLK